MQLCAVAATHAPTRQRPSAAPGASARHMRVRSAAQLNFLHVRAMPAQALTSNSDPRRPKPNLGSSRADVLEIQVQPSARASVRSPTARTMHVHTIRSLASKLMHESNTAGRYLCAAARSACSETLSKVLVNLREEVRGLDQTTSQTYHMPSGTLEAALLMRKARRLS